MHALYIDMTATHISLVLRFDHNIYVSTVCTEGAGTGKSCI